MQRRGPLPPRRTAVIVLIAWLAFAASAGVARAECSTAGLPDGRLVAELQTSLGEICIELLDAYDEAPGHVKNFLFYLYDGRLVDSTFHRSVPGFIVQGGENRFVGDGFERTETFEGVVVHNEPCTRDTPIQISESQTLWICSERGNEPYTVALAKIGGLPDSGTNSWFFNLGDNRLNLDNQNGGFTVFGRVTDPASRAVVDHLGAPPQPYATYDELFWASEGTQPLAALISSPDPVPLFAPLPPRVGDGSDCFDMTELATLLQPDLTTLRLEPHVPADESPYYVTLPASCGTPLAGPLESWIPQPGPPDCPDLDRVAIRTLAPTAQTVSVPRVRVPFEYVTFTCEQLEEAIALRDAYRADVQDAVFDGLVFIDDAQLRFAPEPSSGSVAASALGAFAWLRGRARRREARACGRLDRARGYVREIGRRSTTWAPPSAESAISMCPSRSPTAFEAIARPRPEPGSSVRVVKKGSKTRSR